MLPFSLPQLAHGLVLGEAVHILPTSFFRLTNKPLHVHTNKAGISFLCINQSICHTTKLLQADDLDSFTIYTHVNFDFLQMHVLHDCPQQLSMRALMVVESQVYTDHNVDMHQSDSCMFDSAAQNLVSISGCKT